jgi:hypothetical protein
MRITLRVAWTFLWLFAGSCLACAASLALNGSCSYFGETLPAKIEVAASTENVDGLIQRIVDASGLSRNFEVRAALVPNATAVTLGSKRYILYNPSFMSEIASVTQDRWAAAGILAHEIGHHLNGHTLQAGGSRPPLELEADYFSGFILEKLGAQMGEATAVIEKFAPETATATHPGRVERVASISSGWLAACKKDPDCPKDTISLDDVAKDDIPSAASSRPDSGRSDKALMKEVQ